MIDPRDTALQRSCPTLAAPRFGALPAMHNGQRVIVAANGVFVQVKLDWLDCIVRIAYTAPVPPLPYGTVRERIDFAFGVIPISLLEAFIEAGRTGLPNEIAGGLIYSRRTKNLRLQVYDALRASPDGVEYRMPSLDDDESIAIDLHTHGIDRAFWSFTDNRDDQGVQVAGVFGNLDRDKPSAAFRLAVNGYYKPIRHPWEKPLDANEIGAEVIRDLDPRTTRSILRWLGVGRSR
jgi:PRTRC genetic system protein A